MSKKLARIKAICEADPSNPFGWYSLAMETKKADVADAIRIFDQLHTDHPDYLATYYHFAATLAEDGEMDRARTIYEEGIALATKQGDAHTRGELEDALDLL